LVFWVTLLFLEKKKEEKKKGNILLRQKNQKKVERGVYNFFKERRKEIKI